MRIISPLLCAVVIPLMLSACMSAQQTPPSSGELRTDAIDPQIKNLVSLLTGEFDSRRQMEADRAASLSGEAAHGRVNRVFVNVDAPKVASPVLVGSTRYGGAPWRFDEAEFLVWTFRRSDDGRKIIMSPRRFKEQEDRIVHALNPDKLAGFGPEDLEQAVGAAACDVIWSQTEAGYVAHTSPCSAMSTIRKEELAWAWSYKLEKNALWVEFSGTDSSGKVVYQTPIDSPYRLDRIR